MFWNVRETCVLPMAISVAAEKNRRERGERYKRNEPTTVGEVDNLLFDALMSIIWGGGGGNFLSAADAGVVSCYRAAQTSSSKGRYQGGYQMDRRRLVSNPITGTWRNSFADKDQKGRALQKFDRVEELVCDPIVVESTRACWSDDSSGIPDPTPDCCLLTDVVSEALPEEPGLQPLGPSPGGTQMSTNSKVRKLNQQALMRDPVECLLKVDWPKVINFQRPIIHTF
ncbi:hypothetical protein GEV33_006834 [Tenebrio molitor]|uniref:Uncharacterized protein n=1 Tax=Tenebrio molitor TaxID=7067 RepID=A0A8J6HJB8_TENMO|nr:hypothetical protein GEV33_006834 [Tenebrio molitor]